MLSPFEHQKRVRSLCSFSLTMSEKKKTAMIDSTQGKSTSCIQRHAWKIAMFFLLGRCWYKERALKKNENIQTMVKLDEIRSWEMKSLNKTFLQIQFGCWKVINQLLPSDPLVTQMEVTNNPWKGDLNPVYKGHSEEPHRSKGRNGRIIMEPLDFLLASIHLRWTSAIVDDLW